MTAFTGSRYITIGIKNEIPLEYQIVMWEMIDDDRRMNKTLDYLQVFELKPSYENGKTVQKIIHTQEQPRRKSIKTVDSDDPISATIFVIDDISHITMLLSHEY